MHTHSRPTFNSLDLGNFHIHVVLRHFDGWPISVHRPKRHFLSNVNRITRAFLFKFLNEQNDANIDVYNCYCGYYILTVHSIFSISVLMVIASSCRVHHICFFRIGNPITVLKILARDHMTSRQFHRWKLVMTL